MGQRGLRGQDKANRDRAKQKGTMARKCIVLCTNNQQTNLNHKRTGNPTSRTSPFIALRHINSRSVISMSLTSPFICFGAHQQPQSNIHVPN